MTAAYRVRNLLLQLGDNPDAIADYLREHGHTGKVDDGTCCPVANYLADNGSPELEVVTDFIYYAEADQDPEGRLLATPPAIAEFVRAFDAHAYPDLIDQEQPA